MTISSSELTADGLVGRGSRPGVGAWLRTTPGRMRIFSVVSIVMIGVLLVIGATSIAARRSAANSVGNDSGPRFADTVGLYRALADADATATGAVLHGGNWHKEDLDRYREDLDRAGRFLTSITINADGARAAQATAISQQLLLYTSQVEAARTNIRFGFPIGAEHMRQASERMRDSILDPALALNRSALDDLHRDYDAGTSANHIAWIAAIAIIALVTLALGQFYVTRRTNRVLNPALLGASVIVLIVAGGAIGQFVVSQDNLVDARREGSDSVEVLSDARILGLQAQADASLGLAERGTGATYLASFEDTITKLGGTDCLGGLIGDARRYALRTGDEGHIDGVAEMCTKYRAAHEETLKRDGSGDYKQAVEHALSTEADAGETMDQGVAAEIARAQARFDSSAADARVGFGFLAGVLVVGLIAAGALVFVGLQRRIGEYR